MILTPGMVLSPLSKSSLSGTLRGPAVRAPELTIKSAVTIRSTQASNEPRTLLTKAAIVKIAARLITIVATVIPERAGLRRKLSDANLACGHDKPRRRGADCQNDRTASFTSAGQKNARPSKNSSMPVTPRLKRSTATGSDGESASKIGAAQKQQTPRRFAKGFLARDAGRQAACRALSRGLIRIASQAGIRAARRATATPLPRARTNSIKPKDSAAKSTSENRLATVSPTATSAA